MSSRGILSNKLYVSVDIPFEKVWDDLGTEEQKRIVLENINLIDTDDLISELKNRGFCVTKED